MLRTLIIAMAVAAAPVVAGNIKELDTVLAPQEYAAYPGHEFVSAVSAANEFALNHDQDSAWATLAPVLEFCDVKKNIGKDTFVSVPSQGDEAEYLGSTDGEMHYTFIDMACPKAYKTAAFLSVQAKQPERAFSFLDRAQELAPHWAEALTERAYLIGSLGDRPKSLTTYKAALDLTNRYPSSAYMKAVVLRGIGFALTEMGDLSAARKAYEDSLVVEPTNQLAKGELIYIEKLQEKSSTSN